ncbi:MAG: hypothetical protein A3C36_06465 [Omnitrophica WOR_2 bacterium RIFCSPHIGHO2_02_FULL_52_10]|nr:MAG: hypothetical protein A3C36_06465 [Omnitrophica WOR_2 bacterium RIFCSPHIGHO2_02_FULL_52_10]
MLDQFSVADIRKREALVSQFLKYHWDYYKELAYQRSRIADKIKEALLGAAQKRFTFEKWQRAVKYKYATNPLSMRGSLVDPAGGRFNIGDINPSQFPSFPALYIAADKGTALQELLCQKIDPGEEARAAEFALTDPRSTANVSLSGHLDCIINLNSPGDLLPFVELIKNFIIPDYLKKTAQKIGESEPALVRTVPQLVDALLDPNWRRWPMQLDVPTPAQIFGQLVAQAGLEGILYPSKFTGRDCLAIFPQNFDKSDSFVQLDDEAPKECTIRRLDAKTWSSQDVT